VNKEEMNKSLSAEPPEVRCVYHQQTVALRWLREDFAGDLAVGLRRLIRGDMYVRLVGAAVQSKAAFLTSIEEPTCCYRLSRGETPDASQVWVEITPPIAFPILNCLLGGASDDAFLPRRPLTNIERRLLTRVVELIGASLSLAWPGQDKPSFVAEPLTTEATAGARDEQALAVSFEFGVDRQGGMLRLCMDGQFMPAIASPVRPAGRIEGPLEISASLTELPISPADLVGLSAGDILATDSPADGEVVIRVAGIPKFVGKLGICNGKRAVTIVRKIN